jgi:predicted HicB family RNase H-like nuclease
MAGRRHFDRQIGLKVASPLYAELDRAASEQGVTVNEIARAVLVDWATRHALGAQTPEAR